MSAPATTRVVCLCCGARYDEDQDCPRFDARTHTYSRAAKVARFLRDSGCSQPRPLDVRDALAALDAQGRA